MKPNGFVAAASTTSQTSMPIRSQSCASSLTSAMLTERKMFSSSFVSSAASGVETRVHGVDRAAVDRGGRLGARRREAADDLRRRLRRPVGAARVDALGRDREVEVLAGLRGRCPPRGSASTTSRVVPGYVVDSSTTSWPLLQPRRDARARALDVSRGRARAGATAASAARSGSRRASRELLVVGGRGDRGPRRRAARDAPRERPRCGSRRGSARRRRPGRRRRARRACPASAKVCASGTPT